MLMARLGGINQQVRCEGKVGIPTEALARAAARRCRGRAHYLCPVCGLWHTGTPSPRPPTDTPPNWNPRVDLTDDDRAEIEAMGVRL